MEWNASWTRALHQKLSLWDRKTCHASHEKWRGWGDKRKLGGEKGNIHIYIKTWTRSINRDVSASCLREAIIVACIGEVRPRPTRNPPPPRAVLVFGTCRHFQERASGFSTRSLFSEIRERRHGMILARRQTGRGQQKSMTMESKVMCLPFAPSSSFLPFHPPNTENTNGSTTHVWVVVKGLRVRVKG